MERFRKRRSHRCHAKRSFDYLITSDKNLRYQQNISKYAIGFIVLNVPNNTYEIILPLINKIKEVLVADEVMKLVIIE